jgi:hypothetical protein
MIDFTRVYTVDGDVAFRIYPRMIPDRCDDGERTDYEYPDEQFVIGVMVGDDLEFTLDVDDLVAIDDDDYCAQCGQIGCAHDGRDRD